ncbi:hypothetical protein [Sphingomonas sp. TREG-RG-20F-R18-01]|uniref:hypothetical protein n=1 Tax=Sphingomonas sp. TREG-RG-20F-R18-01 TaxID=2914982 RepID=UPI001F5966C5|nr:hypothetical protein [Sphingomonas sp. TREG-RG-20F-R18-01]
MNRILRDILSGADNHSIEAGRVLWVIGCLSMVVFEGVAIGVKGQAFDPVTFGLGFASLLAAGGFGIAQKDKALKASTPNTPITNAETVNIGSPA